MPSVIESVLEDFDDLDLEVEPEGVAAAEVWEEAEGVPMGIRTDVRDEEVAEAEVVVQLSSTSKRSDRKQRWSSVWYQQPQRPLCVRFSSTRIDEDKAGRSTNAACANIGACVALKVEEHRLVRQSSAWNWRRYTNNLLRGGRTKQLKSLLAQITGTNGGKTGHTFAPESLANI